MDFFTFTTKITKIWSVIVVIVWTGKWWLINIISIQLHGWINLKLKTLNLWLIMSHKVEEICRDCSLFFFLWNKWQGTRFCLVLSSHIYNPVEHLIWSALKKESAVEYSQLFLQKCPSQMFQWVLNTYLITQRFFLLLIEASTLNLSGIFLFW